MRKQDLFNNRPGKRVSNSINSRLTGRKRSNFIMYYKTTQYPPLTEYRGFYIDRLFQIFKNGREIFKAHWQRCCDLESAKRMIDTSLEAKAKFDRLPNLGYVRSGVEELENGAEAAEQFSEWMNEQAEKQLNDHEQNY